MHANRSVISLSYLGQLELITIFFISTWSGSMYYPIFGNGNWGCIIEASAMPAGVSYQATLQHLQIFPYKQHPMQRYSSSFKKALYVSKHVCRGSRLLCNAMGSRLHQIYQVLSAFSNKLLDLPAGSCRPGASARCAAALRKAP